MEKPLAYWALPNDRRLPLAFLGRTLQDLLQTPFEQLSATPGIGQKKITSLVKLLHRATNDNPPTVPFGNDELVFAPKKEALPDVEAIEGKFDPAVVSEALWSKWRDTVRKHNVGQEMLGRLAPTLQSLPTVIWHTPLSKYLNYTVGEIRQLRTHGEKRVRAVLEIFHSLHEALSGAGQPEHLSLRLTPTFVPVVEEFVADVLAHPGIPTPEELREKLIQPMLKQLEVDAGETVYKLAAGRLGLDGPPQSVRQQARRMGVTRARIYQLLDDCSKVFDVRWPEGKMQLDALAQKFSTEQASPEKLQLFNAVRELFYPSKYAEVSDSAFAAAH
ncbi:MAG TPA: hypothetical protein VL096_02055 [Pirellulaceae bacterium]|nr:hypothetical protein [Pirellulaceae bacterium]